MGDNQTTLLKAPKLEKATVVYFVGARDASHAIKSDAAGEAAATLSNNSEPLRRQKYRVVEEYNRSTSKAGGVTI